MPARVLLATITLTAIGPAPASAASPSATASPQYEPVNAPAAITLIASDHPAVLTPLIAPPGTVIACLNHGVRAEMRVPGANTHHPNSGSVALGVAFKKGGVQAHITITRRSSGRIVVICTP